MSIVEAIALFKWSTVQLKKKLVSLYPLVLGLHVPLICFCKLAAISAQVITAISQGFEHV